LLVKTRAPCSAAERGVIAKMLTKCLSPTRLVTRTKEFNMYASTRVANPRCEMKVRGRKACGGSSGAPSTDHASLTKDLSVSVPVETRKMVNYACAGRSQGKPWWRLVAILTCKLIVGFGCEFTIREPKRHACILLRSSSTSLSSSLSWSCR